MLLGIGNSNSTAIFIVFVGVYFLLTLSTVAAVGSVDPRLIKTARTYGACKQQVWQWVIFPAVLPQVFITLRINFFAAWMAVLATEMVGLKNGVGMMVILGREMFNGNLIMLGICIVGIVGYAVDSFLLFVQRKVLWWKQRGRDEFTHLFPCRQDLAVEALRDVSLSVSSGEFVALLGPSGCGKSTLLELFAGLEPINSGEVRIDDSPVTGPDPNAVMMFQEHSLFPWLNVEDNVAFGLKMKGVEPVERRRRTGEVLERVRLTKFAKHFPHQLSGGMKQRVAIARALVGNPAFILMDEPFAALDFQTRVLMQQFLLEIWSGFRSTILFVTHQIDEAVLLSDRVVVFSAGPGRILEDVTLTGEWVQLSAFIVRTHDDTRWMAVDQAGACPDCSPSPVAAIQLPGFELAPGISTELPLRLRGHLSYGLLIGEDGYASFLRLEQAHLFEGLPS